MASNWVERNLGDVLEIKYGKDHKKLNDGNIPCFGSGGIMRYVENSIYEQESILIPRKGSLNNIYYIDQPFWTVDTLFWTKINPEIVFPKFLFYQLKLTDFVSLNVGSAVPSLTVPVLNDLKIKLPPVAEQKAIAHILGTLDDKIELNRQMNETLEAMAQALFKSWFVDFDPVIDNALTSGNTIPDQLLERAEQRKAIKKKDNSDIQDLFPDTFEFTEEMGWIPESWASDTVKELANVTDYVANGSFASLKENVTLSDDPEYALYIRTTDYKNDFSLAKAKYVNKHSYDFLKKSILEGYEVIISNVGDTGTVFRPPVWLNQPMTLGSNAIAIKNENMSNFLQYYFSSCFGQYQISSIVGGSAQPKFNKTDFRALAVYFGSLELVSKFEEACQPLRAKIDTNLSQILLLSNIHNTLLPKLMSGELRIPDAAALVDEAV
ncbi:restriction endonuclease subunit S [Psychrobacter sp.]|uniref:restriction endonuclease subunit S n=1 Tax=Psychrobacter sp. TaxID=56811 RepID=UPI0035690EB1